MFETRGNLLTISPYKIIKNLYTSNIEWHKINIPIPKVKESEYGKEQSKSDQSPTGKASKPVTPFPESGHMMKLVVLHPSRYATCNTRNFSAGLIPLHAHRHPRWVSYSHDFSSVLHWSLVYLHSSIQWPLKASLQGTLIPEHVYLSHLLLETMEQKVRTPSALHLSWLSNQCHADDFSKYYSQLKMKCGSLGLRLYQLKYGNPWKHSSR